jgi:ribose-phosphate pyrophosphokinase
LLLVREALRPIRPILRITYVPYSRMDRESDTYVFSLKVFTSLINTMYWERVIIYEPHSDVTPALLDRVQVVKVTTALPMRLEINKHLKDYQLCYPDVGAFKRYSEDLKSPDPLIGFKIRDFETGKILSLNIEGNKRTDEVLIVDDLCSRGGTFVLAAKTLRQMGFKKIVLAVAHCENTIYLGEVFNYIDKVITTDSILDEVTYNAIEYQHKGKLVAMHLTNFKWDI